MSNKTELQMIIKRKGILNNQIADLIAFNNEWKKTYTLDEIESWIKCKVSEYPSTLRNMRTTHLHKELIILEDGEHETIIIQLM